MSGKCFTNTIFSGRPSRLGDSRCIINCSRFPPPNRLGSPVSPITTDLRPDGETTDHRKVKSRTRGQDAAKLCTSWPRPKSPRYPAASTDFPPTRLRNGPQRNIRKLSSHNKELCLIQGLNCYGILATPREFIGQLASIQSWRDWSVDYKMTEPVGIEAGHTSCDFPIFSQTVGHKIKTFVADITDQNR
ncbi:hypothetical protein J6590_046893 [Homalodisca vitripennis]|nr:hypothetical protein J6590_046893 [Homalodisca vitripennis]